MFLFLFTFVFAGAKSRRGEISKFQLLISADRGVATFKFRNVLEKTCVSGVYPYLFCCANPGLHSVNRNFAVTIANVPFGCDSFWMRYQVFASYSQAVFSQ